MSFLDFLTPKKEEEKISTVLPKEIYESSSLELKDIIAPSALKVTPKEVNLGEKVCRSFFVISYPRFLTESWFSPIINLDKIFDISLFIEPIDTAQVLRTFQKKVAEVQSQISQREQKGLVRNPMLDTAYQDLENLRDQLQQAQERLFDVGLYVTIYADSTGELDKVESEIKSILEAKLVYVKPALFQQEQAFKTAMPIGKDELKVYSKLNSSPLSSLFPFTSFDLTSDKGILYGINRHNSSLVLFDRFSLENYNSVTLAKSGSGKSILGSEQVLFKENGKVALKTIEEVVLKKIKDRGLVKIDHELEGVIDPKLEVFTFNKNLKGQWSSVSLAARKIAPDTFYHFETKSGRRITTTGDHNMLVLRNGEVVVTKSTDVSLDEYIPLPRKVLPSQNSDNIIDLLDLFAKNKKIYVAGGENFIEKNYKHLKTVSLDARLDRYLYKYRTGRRIPVDYFLKAIFHSKTVLDEKAFQQLKITSASGKAVLPSQIKITESFGRILGYIVSEGTVTDTIIIISNTDPEVLADIKKCFKEIGVNCYNIPGAIASAEIPFVELIKATCGKYHSGQKRAPSFLFNASPHIISAFLKAYFEGDGGVERGSVTALSKSKELISDLSYLLYFFGVSARIHKRLKRYSATNGKRIFWQLSVSGQNNLHTFREKIGFVTKRKQGGLRRLCQLESNTNVDIIPSIAKLLEELREIFPGQLHGIANLSPLGRAIYNPSPKELGRVTVTIKERVYRFKNIAPVMDSLGSLPNIEDLIKLGESNKEYNKKLWKELGSSWAWMKNRVGEPGLANVLALAKVTLGEKDALLLENRTKRIYGDFLGLNISIKETGDGASLRKAYSNDLPDRTSYTMVKEAANFISETYKNISSHLPRIEQILETLEKLSCADLSWDPIVKIEKIANKKEKYVYDLTVDNEVFLAGLGGMFIHNSYGTKLEILRTLMFDTDVIVIDPEKEYEYMAEAVGGRYFNISLNSEHHINPFELPPPAEGESFTNVLRSNIINLVGLFRIMMGGLTPEEDAIIDRAITETYALKDITADSNSENMEPPLMSDFELVLSGMEGGESLAQRLTKYTRGTWAGFINRPSNIDINKKFIVFSLRDMEDELKQIAMYIVTHYIWNAIRKKLKKRLLVIDEAWWMMKSEDTASFLLSLAKRGRKYYLGLATITQDVDDFMKSPYGMPIVTNSSIQILLKQSPTSIDRLQEAFHLTDEEKYLLLESDVGEGIFFAGLKHVAVKIIASYTEDQIITSDPSQILAIKKAKADLEHNS